MSSKFLKEGSRVLFPLFFFSYLRLPPFCFFTRTTRLSIILSSYFLFLKMCSCVAFWHWVFLRRSLRPTDSFSPCRWFFFPQPRCLKYFFLILEIKKQNLAPLAWSILSGRPGAQCVRFCRTDSVLSFQEKFTFVVSLKSSLCLHHPLCPPHPHLSSIFPAFSGIPTYSCIGPSLSILDSWHLLSDCCNHFVFFLCLRWDSFQPLLLISALSLIAVSNLFFHSDNDIIFVFYFLSFEIFILISFIILSSCLQAFLLMNSCFLFSSF